MLCRFFTSRAFLRPCRTPPPSRAALVPHSAMTLHVVTPCCISATSAALQWACPIAPNQADSHNGTASKLSLRAQKQKIGRAATFLRLGIATDPSNRRLDRKSAGGLLQSGYFSLCRGGGEPLIAKKLQKRSDFCFCGRWIAAAGQIPQRVDRRSGGGSCKRRTVAAGADPGKGGLPQRGRSYKGLVQREAACPFAPILLRALLATMIQFV